MRTTLDKEDDVLAAAKELARRQGTSAGHVVSGLLRVALSGRGDRADAGSVLGVHNAWKAAENYRTLRSKGITVRKTIDGIIATACIEANLPLLFSDRGFLPYVNHLGLEGS